MKNTLLMLVSIINFNNSSSNNNKNHTLPLKKLGILEVLIIITSAYIFFAYSKCTIIYNSNIENNRASYFKLIFYVQWLYIILESINNLRNLKQDFYTNKKEYEIKKTFIHLGLLSILLISYFREYFFNIYSKDLTITNIPKKKAIESLISMIDANENIHLNHLYKTIFALYLFVLIRNFIRASNNLDSKLNHDQSNIL